ncbi:MAG: ATP-binding protein [Lachnospiraceae bacterium]|nr:ATP-binding protein [Lachnospiraceae bacterium]
MKVSGSVSRKFGAETGNFPAVWEFVSQVLTEYGVDEAVLMQIELGVEEVFVNIASYAYPGTKGEAEVAVSVEDGAAILRFTDSGVAFDPLAAPAPDTDLPAEERQIGGLGIYLVKEMMDDVSYRYEDGKNVLVIKKLLRA